MRVCGGVETSVPTSPPHCLDPTLAFPGEARAEGNASCPCVRGTSVG